jgi:hypothetical protein
MGWYTFVQDALEQGDFISRFPILIPPYSDSLDDLLEAQEGERVDKSINTEFYNVIVITQSCDLIDFDDQDTVILCPRFDYALMNAEQPREYGPNGWANLKRGRVVGKHLLNKCDLPNHEFDYQVVDLRKIFSVPYGLVKEIASREKSRTRLTSPYREQLAQAFAYQFMRVGLIEDLPSKYPYQETK